MAKTSPAPGGADDQDVTTGTGILVVSTHLEGGRRRAGRQFERAAVEISVSDLSDAEIAAIEGDPELTVKRLG
jgi:hypothetical protein